MRTGTKTVCAPGEPTPSIEGLLKYGYIIFRQFDIFIEVTIRVRLKLIPGSSAYGK